MLLHTLVESRGRAPDEGVRELRLVERRVGAVRGEQLVVGALLDDRAVLHHQDQVGVADRRQPVRDHEADVRPLRSAVIACWMSSSVRVSTELVASSRISIAGSARNARAMVMSCFSPR